MTGRLLVDQVTKRHGAVEALRQVSLTCGSGVTALLGRNGAGKSTLCRILAGVEKANSGLVEFDGLGPVDGVEGRHFRRRVGYMPQSLALPPAMTVHQYVSYSAWLKEVPADETGETVSSVLGDVHLTDLAGRRIKTLSGGMRRRAGLAAALVGRPELLVLDEPSVGLDPEQRAHFYEVVHDVAGDRCTLLSTHLLEDVEALATSAVVLDSGSVRFAGPLHQLAAIGEGTSERDRLRSGFLSVAGNPSRTT